jgi:hypothetical protein
MNNAQMMNLRCCDGESDGVSWRKDSWVRLAENAYLRILGRHQWGKRGSSTLRHTLPLSLLRKRAPYDVTFKLDHDCQVRCRKRCVCAGYLGV